MPLSMSSLDIGNSFFQMAQVEDKGIYKRFRKTAAVQTMDSSPKKMLGLNKSQTSKNLKSRLLRSNLRDLHSELSELPQNYSVNQIISPLNNSEIKSIESLYMAAKTRNTPLYRMAVEFNQFSRIRKLQKRANVKKLVK